MKRIRKAALVAAILAFSGASQAQSPTTRSRAQLEDALTAHAQPRAHRASDPTEQRYAVGLDYIQESRLNDRQRDEQRHKARAQKEQARSGE